MLYCSTSNILFKLIVVQLLLLLAPLLLAQQSRDAAVVRFGQDFRFRDGIYANFDMVRSNCPIPPTRVVTDLEDFNKKFYENVLSEGSMVLYDDQGVRVVVNNRNIWGYAYMGTMYLQIGGRFHRLLSEGMLSRIIASATVWEELGPGSGEAEGYLPYSTSSKRYNPVYFEVARRKEILLLNFEDNLLTAFSPEALMSKLEKDSVLYREYSSLGDRKRKKRMVEYVKIYNQRHPIYFPADCVD